MRPEPLPPQRRAVLNMRKGIIVNRHNYQQLQNNIARAIVTCREARLSLTEQLCTALKRRAKDAGVCRVMRDWLAHDEDLMRAMLTGPYNSVYGDELSVLWSQLLVTGWMDSVRQVFRPRPIPQDDMVSALRTVLHSRTKSLQLPIFRATSPRVLHAITSLKSYVLSDLLKSELFSAVNALKSGAWTDVWPSGVRLLQSLHAIEAKLEYWSQQPADSLAARARNTPVQNSDASRKNREYDDDLEEFDLWLESPEYDDSDSMILPIWMMLYMSELSAHEEGSSTFEQSAAAIWQEPVYIPEGEHVESSAGQGADTMLHETIQDEQWSRRTDDGNISSQPVDQVADNGVQHSALGSFS